MNDNYDIYSELGIDKDVYLFGENICSQLYERFSEVDRTAEYNQLKVIKAMLDNNVG